MLCSAAPSDTDSPAAGRNPPDGEARDQRKVSYCSAYLWSTV